MKESFKRAFIADDRRVYRFKLGQVVASALSGFVVGVVSASIIWMVAIYYINNFVLTQDTAAPEPKEVLQGINPFGR